MPGCKQPSHDYRIRGANDNTRVEPNTGEWDKNPVPFRKDGNAGNRLYDSQGLNIIAVALVIVLAAAVVYLAR